MSTSLRKRALAAEKTRLWREANWRRPDTRRCDRVIVEAVVEHLRQTPGSEGLMREIVDHAVAGLVLQEYPEAEARREVARRLRYLTTPAGIASGTVRGALDRRRYEKACPLSL
ncbi:hypothetical protein SAMN06297251_10157 [Fulvimarina manganoxydans]|uniref:Uncharacterized protein n=1 Tax=Fulvimarina manganoxydans TaxID=937218 RepID=A0A1W1Y9U7_9HYPH|nr:hypothetical protein [Fulvimarina manganoxydans]SMC32621.1 hypothetical protein SAMN06297251_10157 [Fulvimarina manganoxydans]